MILRGLFDNERLLIQDPPGSGKSSYGMEYSENKLHEGKHGLYLTYNLLLTDHLKRRFESYENLDICSLFEFYMDELDAAGYSYEIGDYRGIEKAFMALDVKHKRYDFIVVDEAQDLFSKNLLKILNDCASETQSGLSEGEYLILYDRAQAFDKNGMACLEQIQPHAAKFNLLKNFRAAGSDELAGFVDECFQGVPDFEREYQDIEILTYDSYGAIANLLFGHITNQISNQVFDFQDMVILYTTDLLKRSKSEVDFFREGYSLSK